MDDKIFTALIAFGGVIVGAIVSFIGMIWQARVQDRRERMRLVYQAALEEHKRALEHSNKVAETGKRRMGTPPLYTFINYQYGVMQLLEKGNMTPESLEKIDQEYTRLIKHLEQKEASREVEPSEE